MKANLRIDLDWLPLPQSILSALQWKEGDHISVEVVGDTLICTKIETPDPAPRRSPLPLRRKLR